MNELNFRQLRYVVAMADVGSISGAARSLDVAQPTLSSSLREAENSLGVTLFLRSRGKSLALTAEGRLLLPEIRRLVGHAEDVSQRALGLAAPTSGTVHIGSLVTVAPVLLPPLLAAFGAQLPDATVLVTTGDQESLLAGLCTGDLHLALTYDLNIDDGIEFIPIATVRPAVMLPSLHPLSGRRAIRLKSLVNDHFILLDLPISTEYFQAVFLAAKASMRPAMRCSDLSFVRALVAEGLGYSVVNLVPAASKDDRLSYVPIDEVVPNLQLGFAVARRPMPAATAEFQALALKLLPKLLTTRVRRG